MKTVKPIFELEVGDVVKLLVSAMGNPVGTLGIVIENYETGATIIFPNGQFCGWGNDEFSTLLKTSIKPQPTHQLYEFQNAMKVSQDFRAGFWSFPKPKKGIYEALKELKTDEGARAFQDEESAQRRLREINRLVGLMIAAIENHNRLTAEMQESDRQEERFIYAERANPEADSFTEG